MSFVNFGAQPETTMRLDPMLEAQLQKPPTREDSEVRLTRIKNLMLKMLFCAKKVHEGSSRANEALKEWNASQRRFREAEEQTQRIHGGRHLMDFSQSVGSLSDALARQNEMKKNLEEAKAAFFNLKEVYLGIEEQLKATKTVFGQAYMELRKAAREELASTFDPHDSFRRGESDQKFRERKIKQEDILLPLLKRCEHYDTCGAALPELISFLEGL